MAIQYQICSKLQHELRMILPHLHGIKSLLHESSQETIASMVELKELFSTTSRISGFAVMDTSGIPSKEYVRTHYNTKFLLKYSSYLHILVFVDLELFYSLPHFHDNSSGSIS